MRTHGWGGQIPATDEEAIARILAATREVIDQRGAATGLADVARTLGVTRQTVYRYFGSTEALLTATALDAIDGFLDRLIDHLGGITEPDKALVEGIATVLERLPRDKHVGLLLAPGRVNLPAVGGFTSEVGRQFVGTMMERLDVDWDGGGYDTNALDIIGEIVLRTMQSMVLDPELPEWDHADLRVFVDQWSGAAIRELGSAPPPR
ncbi:TetR/AcrR family transcriptional regulator [Gordonia sinesedis]